MDSKIKYMQQKKIRCAFWLFSNNSNFSQFSWIPRNTVLKTAHNAAQIKSGKVPAVAFLSVKSFYKNNRWSKELT